VNVAAGYGIPDAEQSVTPGGVGGQPLRCGTDEGIQIDLTAVGRVAY
jgi:hypothetical protein